MQSPSPCTTIQERIVLGQILDEGGQSHVLACAGCGRLAADFMALDALVSDGIDGGIVVPGGFADRVMAGLAPDAAAVSRFESLLGRRWVQLALAQVGLAVAIANLLRFVFSTLMPAASLGGLR